MAYSVAAGVDLTDSSTADVIASWATASLENPVGEGRVKWLQNKCHQSLKPKWEPRKVKNAQCLTSKDVLSPPMPGVVTVYQVQDSRGFINHCFAKAADVGGQGWLCDMNHDKYVSLTAEGLDACCIGDTTFKGVVKAFTLIRQDPVMKRAREARENNCPNAKKQKA